MAANKKFIWRDKAQTPQPIEHLSFGSVIAYDHHEGGKPRPDGEPHIGIVFDVDYARSGGKRYLAGLQVLTVGVYNKTDFVPTYTDRTRMIPWDVLVGKIPALNNQNKYDAQLHLSRVPLTAEHLGVEGGIRELGTIADTDWGEKFFAKAESLPMDALHRQLNMDFRDSRMLALSQISVSKYRSNDERPTGRLGASIMFDTDYSVYLEARDKAEAPKKEKAPKIKREADYPKEALHTTQGKDELLLQLEESPDNIPLLLQAGGFHNKALWERVQDVTGVQDINKLLYLSDDEMKPVFTLLDEYKSLRRFEFIRVLDHFTTDTAEFELVSKYFATQGEKAAQSFNDKNAEQVSFVQNLMAEGATVEEIIRRTEDENKPGWVKQLPEAIMSAGYLSYIAPKPATPDLQEEFTQAVKYDVALKDLFLVFNAGAERLGIARLLGSTPEDIKAGDGIVSVVAPDKDRNEITLRDAVNYIESISPEQDVDVIAVKLQQAGSISVASTAKMLAQLKNVYDAVNNIQSVDGKLVSDNLIVERLIERDRIQLAL